jgi:hypothetical protein
VNDEFEQRYDPVVREARAVWVYCRLCRCRMQVRTVARPELPFRCFCGNAGTLAKFDVFQDEEETRRFAGTFEDVYQTTKKLLKEAEMPLPETRMYRAEDIKRMKAGLDKERPRHVDSSDEEAVPAVLDAASYKKAAKALTDALARATGPLARHEALSALGTYAYACREQFPDARRLCYQACETDVGMAREVLADATARFKGGETLRLKFPLFKRLVLLLVEDKRLGEALEVAGKAVALGLPGYEEKVEKIRAQLARKR